MMASVLLLQDRGGECGVEKAEAKAPWLPSWGGAAPQGSKPWLQLGKAALENH